MRKIKKKSKKPYLRLLFFILLLLLGFIFLIVLFAKKDILFSFKEESHFETNEKKERLEELEESDCFINTDVITQISGKWKKISVSKNTKEYKCVVSE